MPPEKKRKRKKKPDVVNLERPLTVSWPGLVRGTTASTNSEKLDVLPSSRPKLSADPKEYPNKADDGGYTKIADDGEYAKIADDGEYAKIADDQPAF